MNSWPSRDRIALAIMAKPRRNVVRIHWTALAATIACLSACSGQDNQAGVSTTGGASSAGGSAPFGGSTSAGGSGTTGGLGNTGGFTGSSGTLNTGGLSSSGGAQSTGGSQATGGTPAAGGSLQTAGGSKATGGTQSIGGSQATGGSKAAGGTRTSGGTNAAGGTQALGGSKASGGSTAAGGTLATGGSKATGGTQASGGSKASGGTQATGDATSTSCPYTGHVTYNVSKSANPTAEEQNAYTLIAAAMDKAIAYYNCYTNLTKAVTASYVPSVSTADGNSNGSIRFGSDTSYMDYRTAMHEIAHTLGVGTSSKWAGCVDTTNKLYTCAAGKQQLKDIDTQLGNTTATVLHADTQHFWPYGINYQSEVKSEADLIFHCEMVMAIVKDLT